MNLFIQMFPKHFSKIIHQSLDFLASHIHFACSAFLEISLELLQTNMNLLVLAKKIEFLPKLGHSLGQDREDVLLFDRMVKIKLGAELQSHYDHLASRQAARALL